MSKLARFIGHPATDANREASDVLDDTGMFRRARRHPAVWMVCVSTIGFGAACVLSFMLLPILLSGAVLSGVQSGVMLFAGLVLTIFFIKLVDYAKQYRKWTREERRRYPRPVRAFYEFWYSSCYQDE